MVVISLGGDRAELGDARPDRLAVDQHGAGAAPALAAAVLGAGQAEVVAQHPEQRPLFLGADADLGPVDPELLDVGHEDGPPGDGTIVTLAGRFRTGEALSEPHHQATRHGGSAQCAHPRPSSRHTLFNHSDIVAHTVPQRIRGVLLRPVRALGETRVSVLPCYDRVLTARTASSGVEVTAPSTSVNPT